MVFPPRVLPPRGELTLKGVPHGGSTLGGNFPRFHVGPLTFRQSASYSVAVTTRQDRSLSLAVDDPIVRKMT